MIPPVAARSAFFKPLPRLAHVGAQAQPLERCQPDKAVTQVDDRSAAHDEHVARQGSVQGFTPSTLAAASIGRAASIANTCPKRKFRTSRPAAVPALR